MTDTVLISGQHATASPVERLLQMLFTEPPTLEASNDLALTILHQASPYTWSLSEKTKKRKKRLRRHSISELVNAGSPIERLLKRLFITPQSLTASNALAQALLVPYKTFRGIAKPPSRATSDPGSSQSKSSRPSWRDEAYWLDQLDKWEPCRYHSTRDILPDYEWSRRAEELYHSLIEELFKVLEASPVAKHWLVNDLPMVLWCIRHPTAQDFDNAYSCGSRHLASIAMEAPEAYDRLVRHLNHSDQDPGKPLGYRIFLQPDESTYLRLAAYHRRIKRSHAVHCYYLHKESSACRRSPSAERAERDAVPMR